MNIPYFKFFRTLEEILTYMWTDVGIGTINGVPEKTIWNNSKFPSINDINFWEQIYHEPGNIGIYAAHDPFVEFYIFVFYPIADDSYRGFVKFSSKTGIDDVVSLGKNLGICLKLTPAN
jgi:hypothetical protein